MLTLSLSDSFNLYKFGINLGLIKGLDQLDNLVLYFDFCHKDIKINIY